MSGHSKWATIRRAKAVTDAKRGKIFSKLSRDIIVAAKAGPDPEMNFGLRLAIERAKAENMPADNIERAIKKGSGQDKDGAAFVDVTYEVHGPGGVAILVDCQTDNTNRSLTELRTVVEKTGNKLLPGNSVSWQFQEQGRIVVKPARFVAGQKYGHAGEYTPIPLGEVEEAVINIDGIEDMHTEANEVEVLTDRDNFRQVYQAILALGYKVETAELAKIAKETLKINADDQHKLWELLGVIDELDDVKNVWTNLAD